jgi:intein/homing endonuclease
MNWEPKKEVLSNGKEGHYAAIIPYLSSDDRTIDEPEEVIASIKERGWYYPFVVVLSRRSDGSAHLELVADDGLDYATHDLGNRISHMSFIEPSETEFIAALAAEDVSYEVEILPCPEK